MEWTVLASGPSARSFDPETETHVACVNGSLYLLYPDRVPDAYGLFEIGACRAYAHLLPQLAAMETDLFYRPAVEDMLQSKAQFRDCYRAGELVHHVYGHIPPHHNTPESWMSSGVLMLLVVAHHYQPEKITVYGVDGWEAGEPNYSEGTEGPRGPSRSALWCAMNNQVCSDAIRDITNAYRKTRFVWASEPRHPGRDDWRVTYA